jgi:DNA-binding Lrp family transcriptional regulator
MNNLELKLISELMKNSRRGNRELAKAVGTSQPAIVRLMKRLEKEGYVSEYTMIPNFHQLGYEILALTFFAFKKELEPEEIEKARETTREHLKNGNSEILMFERGMGLGYGAVVVSLHEDYASYIEFRKRARQFQFLDHSSAESFLVTMKDKVHYRPLTFATLAGHVLTLKKNNRD